MKRTSTWRRHRRIALVLGLLLVAGITTAATSSRGDKITVFTAVLNSGQELDTLNNSTATGVASLWFNKKTSQLNYAISYNGLTSDESSAHLHGPATLLGTAAVLVAFPNAVGENPKNGCLTLTKEQVKMLNKGLIYINIHTQNFAGGEIRGQVLPVKGLKYKAPPVENAR